MKRLRVKGGFLGRTRRPFPKATEPLYEYAEAIIWRDCLELAGRRDFPTITVHDLMEHAPGRYDRRQLIKALARMQRNGGYFAKSWRTRFWRRSHTVYQLKSEERRAA